MLPLARKRIRAAGRSWPAVLGAGLDAAVHRLVLPQVAQPVDSLGG